MARFPDSVGYLLELRDAVNEPWFHAACDLALSSDGSAPTEPQLERLWGYFHGNMEYAPTVAAVPLEPAAAGAAPASVFLQSLSGFDGFRKLAPSLRLEFEDQLTLVFGRNGSGKSSLCQALKVLANPEQPIAPLHNVRAAHPLPPAFSYQFRGDTAPTTWTRAVGFGTMAQAIKYFDASIAIRHVTGTLEPGATVELSAFRLELFDFVGRIASAFQRYASQRISQALQRLQSDIDSAKARLTGVVDLTAPPFEGWGAAVSAPFAQYMNGLTEFGLSEIEKLATLNRSAQQFVAASSEVGLRSLRSQQALLGQLSGQLDSLVQLAGAFSLPALQDAEARCFQKKAASAELAAGVFPRGVDAKSHAALIAAAAAMRDLSSFEAKKDQCPLCEQTMGEAAVALFRSYQTFLNSTLQNEILTLERTLQAGRGAMQRLGAFRLADFSACGELLPVGTLDAINEVVSAIVAAVSDPIQPFVNCDAAALKHVEEVKEALSIVNAAQTQLAEAIRVGSNCRQDAATRIAALNAEIGRLKAHQALWAARDSLRDLSTQALELAPANVRVSVYNFATLLRQTTNKGKEAHRELVLGAFEQRLSEEYRRLCGATMHEMGVRLADRGAQQDIIVTPQIGGEHVHRVLSEGELKVHALAVFMCEAACTPHRVLVFDDPATSFDYNYVENFCERLRDLVRGQPETQVVVLTHSWDFFMNLQSVINRSGLTDRMSIQVLEDCATVCEYSERWEELCAEIELIVNGPAEPSSENKARVSGLMRRLVERLTNKHVFNEQRHQYKSKQLQVSAFQAFTKLVALLPAEAEMLRDIFANLSPPEHDDPRNFYATKSRAQFKLWYDEILSIATAIEARKP